MEDKNIATIIQIITGMLRPKQIILFGSRARQAGHPFSDYDIALVGAELNHRTERRLKEMLDSALGIYTVDLVNLDKADSKFRQIVIENGVVVYEN